MKDLALLNQLENAYRMSLRAAFETKTRKAWATTQNIARAYEILVNGYDYTEERYSHLLATIEDEEIERAKMIAAKEH